jgi:hypothetical protein
MRTRRRHLLLPLLCLWAGFLLPIGAAGCGSEFDQLLEDLRDADDNEDVGEALDDFLEDLFEDD